MKPSFETFVDTFPTNKIVENSTTARFIYDNIIWNDDMRIKFVEASEANRPALSACVKQIEEYCLSNPSCDLDLSNPTVRQTIGRMINFSIAPFGYTVKFKRSLSKNLDLKYFVTAMTYRYTGSESEKVVKSIVDC